MSRERWGTFSVADHLRPRAFVADVLLYDRLIVPVPPNPQEIRRWRSLDWNPDQQEKTLDFLGDLVVRVPWDPAKQEAFKTRFKLAKEAGDDTCHLVDFRDGGAIDPYALTRGMLGQEFRPPLPKGVAKVWTLAAYPSFNAYQEDANQVTEEKKRERLTMVLTHQFLVPESPEKSDDEMLKEAVELAKRDDFKEKRAKFHRWQEDIIEQDIPPNKAVEEMEEYLKQFNNVVKKAKSDVYLKYAFMAIPVALSVATAGLGAPLVVAGATGLVSVAAFAKFDRKPSIDAGDCDAAAMIHDIQDRFGMG